MGADQDPLSQPIPHCPLVIFLLPPPPRRQMKWHEACLSISAAILEILNAWENGVLAFESIQVAHFSSSLLSSLKHRANV